MTNTYKVTAKDITEIAREHGASHAELVVEQAESQLGKAAVADARSEVNRILKAEAEE